MANPSEIEQGLEVNTTSEHDDHLAAADVNNSGNANSPQSGISRSNSVFDASSGRSISSVANSTNARIAPAQAQPVLDIDNPGPWTLHHHRPNFISEVDRFESAYDRAVSVAQAWIGGDAKQAAEQRKFEDRRFRISLAELQRMKLRKLQIKLVGMMVDMRASYTESDKWEETLREYVQALQDYDYMGTRSREPSDPFLVTGERSVDHYVLHHAMKNKLDFSVIEELSTEAPIGPWLYESMRPIGGLRNENFKRSEWVKFRKRLGMAVMGAVFLLAPMWIMVLHHTQYTALASTTAFVAVFGLVMAGFLEKEMEVLSSTAAYAAVLVVFVGVSQ